MLTSLAGPDISSLILRESPYARSLAMIPAAICMDAPAIQPGRTVAALRECAISSRMMLETAITVRKVPAAHSSSTASVLDPSLRNSNSLNLSGYGKINAEIEAGPP